MAGASPLASVAEDDVVESPSTETGPVASARRGGSPTRPRSAAPETPPILPTSAHGIMMTMSNGEVLDYS
jgi:hypothetical protein